MHAHFLVDDLRPLVIDFLERIAVVETDAGLISLAGRVSVYRRMLFFSLEEVCTLVDNVPRRSGLKVSTRRQ